MKNALRGGLALLLVLSLGLGLLAVGYAGETPGEWIPPEEHMEISIMHWDIETSLEGKDDAMRKFIEDRFNITFVGKPGITWDNYYEMPFVWAAAGEFPDIISGVDMASWNGQYEWIRDGLLRPIPSDLSAYPNVNTVVSASDVQAFAVDGENYMLPRAMYPDPGWWCMDRGIFNRKDWREALGFGIPVTEQDFIDLCVAYATMDPDGKGAGYTKGLGVSGKEMPYSQCFASFGYTDSYWVLNEDGECVLPAFEKTSLPLISFLRELHKAGGLDEDYLTDDEETGLREKFAQSKVGMAINQVSPGHLFNFMQEWARVNDDPESFIDCVEILQPPVVEGIGKPVAFSEKTFWSETYINKDVDDEKMERILMLFDYMYSEEALYLVTYGFEGKDWEFDAEGNVVLLTDIHAETGQPMLAIDLYEFCWSLNYLALWADSPMQYSNPGYPQGIREMCQDELEYRLANWEFDPVDWAIDSMDVEDAAEWNPEFAKTEWPKIFLDTSDRATEELFDEAYARWEANGYAAAKEAMTAAAVELGYVK